MFVDINPQEYKSNRIYTRIQLVVSSFSLLIYLKILQFIGITMNKKRQASQIRKEKYKELLDLGGIIGTYITF